MRIELSLWSLLPIAIFCACGVYALIRWLHAKQLNSLNSLYTLEVDKNEISLELESVLVTTRQLEATLQNLELLHRSKNQFYYSTSHDLRQPLHALSMFSSVLQKQPLDDASREIVSDISEAVLDVTREIDTLLNIARLDVDILRPCSVDVNLDSETRRIVQQYQRAAKAKGLQLQVNTTTCKVVRLDRALFDRILRNLIDNAIKFTNQGHVQVSMACTRDNVAQVSVSDTGIGISEGDRERLYKEFYRGAALPQEGYPGGLGLGLSNVSKMVSRLGGEISVEPQAQNGTTVIVDIPFADVAEPHEGTVEVADSLHTNRGKTVLVLEYDLNAGKSTNMLLESAGYKVLMADSITAAHVYQREHEIDAACLESSSRHSVIIKLIEALRVDKSEMPVVVMAADDLMAEIQIDPPVSMLSKPVNPKVLLQKLELAD